MHGAALSPMSRRHCDEDRIDEENGLKKQDPRWETGSDEGRAGTDNTYVATRIVRHNGFGSRLRYVLRLYGYSNADDTARRSPLHSIYLHQGLMVKFR